MTYFCSECEKPVEVVGDGLAVMHQRAGRMGNVNKTKDEHSLVGFIGLSRDYPEWCPGSGKPVREAVR